LVFSTNTVFCQVSVEVGGDQIKDVAHRMGIKSPLGDFPSIVLGAYEVSPLEMASAYSTLANIGMRVDNYLIERIEDADGNVLYQHQVSEQRVLEEALAAAVVNTMEQAVDRGTGGASYLGRPQAGKTGTHENHTDVWFVGYVPQYTTAVWVGYADSQVEMRNVTINGTFYSRAFGGSVAAPIWRQFMEIVVDGLPVQDFPPDPDGIEVFYQTPKAEVPSVVGLTQAAAVDKLLKAGFNVSVNLVNSEEEENIVVEQSPGGGAMVSQGATVTIDVSTGQSPETAMINLIGTTREKAIDRLTRLRNRTGIEFTWTFVNIEVPTRPERNKILSTNPAAGELVTEDTVIVIEITHFTNPGGGGGGDGGDGGDGDSGDGDSGDSGGDSSP
jgi:membrane peptidoglycan carboxypeptidase